MRALSTICITFALAFMAGACTDDNGIGMLRDGTLVISTESLPDAVEGSPYSITLAAIGQRGPFMWELDASSPNPLPAALTLNPTTGVLSGTPDLGLAGSYQLTFKVIDAEEFSVTKTFDFTIVPELTLTGASLPDASTGQAYSTTLMAQGGNAAPTWSIDAGSASQLPTGLALNSITGEISGTPAFGQEGAYAITFAANDGQISKTAVFTLTVMVGPVQITVSNLPDITELAAYSQQLVAMGGSGNYSWSISPNTVDQLPAGIALDPVTGEVSGTTGPNATGVANVTFVVDDGTDTHEMELSINIVPGPLVIFSNSIGAGQENAAYSDIVIASGGTESYAFSVSGNTVDQLPSGLTLAQDGSLTGTPAFDSEGTYNVTFAVSDGNDTVEKAITILINPADLSTVLDELIMDGGGQGGGLLDADDTLAIRVFSEDDNAAAVGFQVLLSDAAGAELAQGVTDANGDLSFDVSMLPGVPAMITYFDATRGHLFTRIGSDNQPLAQAQAYVFGNQQGLDVTVTHAQASKDLVVTLNGEVVHTVDSVTGNENFLLRDLEDFDPNTPWLLVAHLYENDVIGQIDMRDLQSAAFVADTLGENLMANPLAISIDVDSGIGTSTGSLVSGNCSIDSMSGMITPPILAPGLSTFGWTFATLTSPFGSATYSSSALAADVVTGNFLYTIEYPVFPTLAEGNFLLSTRQAVLPIGAVATVGQIPNSFPVAADVPKLVSRQSGLGLEDADFDFSTLPTIGISTLFSSVVLPAKTGAQLDQVGATLKVGISGGFDLLTSTTNNSGNLNFPMLAGTTAPLSFTSADILFAAPGRSNLGFDDNSTLWRSPMNIDSLTASLVGDGDSGSTLARIGIGGGAHSLGALSADMANPLPASFSESGDAITINQNGFETRLGSWNMLLTTTGAAGFTREWQVEIDTRATQAGGDIEFSLPDLPLAWGASFAGEVVSTRIWLEDQHGSGVDPMASSAGQQVRPNASVALLGDDFTPYALRSLGIDLSQAFANTPAYWNLAFSGLGNLTITP